jgi:hypothetical protein
MHSLFANFFEKRYGGRKSANFSLIGERTSENPLFLFKLLSKKFVAKTCPYYYTKKNLGQVCEPPLRPSGAVLRSKTTSHEVAKCPHGFTRVGA